MFRNTLVLLACVATLGIPSWSSAQRAASFTPLFNGRDLEGWETTHFKTSRVTITDGVLHLRGGSDWLLAKRTYYDFVVRFEAKVAPHSIGGLLFYALPLSIRPASAYEVEIGQERGGSLLFWEGRKSTALMEDRVGQPAEGWQSYWVECRDGILTVKIGGEEVFAARGLIHNVGRLGLHVERGSVAFRNIEVLGSDGPEERPIPGVASIGDAGITSPVPEQEFEPKYTKGASRVGAQGAVWIRCVVLPDGSVGEVFLLRGLHADLDEAAVSAARQWRFKPGTRNGEAVPVSVTIEMSFSLRTK